MVAGLGVLGSIVGQSPAREAEWNAAPAAPTPSPSAPAPTQPAPRPAPKPAPTQPPAQPQPAPAPKPAPKPASAVQECGDVGSCIVTPGRAFHHGKHLYMAGWKVTKDDGFGWFTFQGKVRNTSDDASSALITFKLLRNDEVVGTVLVPTTHLQPGQTEHIDGGLSGDDCVKFDQVEVS